MHDWLIATWYGHTRRGLWLAPLAWLFAALTGLRRLGYRLGLLRGYRARVPVIVVGNITVGGTGKTPLVAWLVQQLRARGLAVGVVSRGYGRRGAGAQMVTADADAAEVGDEPLLLVRRLGVRLAVGRERAAAVRLLEVDCDVIVADDGLQHYALARDFEIAVIDGRRGLGNGLLLPAGPLREPATRLARVDAVVVNGSGVAPAGALRMEVEATRLVGVANGVEAAATAFAGRRVHAVAALGHPQRFFELLRRLGITVIEHPFPDHQPLTAADLDFSDGLPVLMTEKDAVKCWRFAGPDAWYLEVAARFADADAARLLDRVEAAVHPPAE
jgi:tetraacyldisaccharide 4'-kinase